MRESLTRATRLLRPSSLIEGLNRWDVAELKVRLQLKVGCDGSIDDVVSLLLRVEVHCSVFAASPVLDRVSSVGLNRPGFRGGSNSREWSHEEVPKVFTRGA